VIVAVVAVRMVQVALDEVVHVVAVRHSFVAAARAVLVVGGMGLAVVVRSACVGILRAHFDRMLVIVALVGVMEVAVVQIVGVTVVFDSGDIAALSEWYCAALGFRITDWLEDKLVFMTTSRYHHQIALAAAPNAGLNHVAYECADVDDFMRATGRAMRLGHRLLWGPGRHGPGDNTFAYFRSPAGFICEFTTGLELTDSPDWVVRTWESLPEQSDLWGTSNSRPNDAFGATADPGLGILPCSPEEARAAR